MKKKEETKGSNKEDWVSVRGFCAGCDVSERTLYSWIQKAGLEAVIMSGSKQYKKQEVMNLVAEKTDGRKLLDPQEGVSKSVSTGKRRDIDTAVVVSVVGSICSKPDLCEDEIYSQIKSALSAVQDALYGES